MASIQILRRRIRSIQGPQRSSVPWRWWPPLKCEEPSNGRWRAALYGKNTPGDCGSRHRSSPRGENSSIIAETRSEEDCPRPHRHRPRIMWGIKYEPESGGGRVHPPAKGAVTVLTVGRKARAFARIAKLDVRAEFSGIGDRATMLDTMPFHES